MDRLSGVALDDGDIVVERAVPFLDRETRIVFRVALGFRLRERDPSALEPAALPGDKIIHGQWGNPAWAEAVASCDPLISDDAAMAYARRYCLFGAPADIRARIAELEQAGVTTLITTPLAGDTARTLPHEFIDSFAAAGLTS